MWKFFLNSVYVTVPAVLLTLFLASMVAYVVSRLSLRFNIPLLILFTAGNLLPQQVIITPLYRIYLPSTCRPGSTAAACSTTRTSA